MISLARHIEILLLEHDCVIIPGFGGFLTNYVEAEISYEDQATLTPPYRTIGFNQALQNNDGLLVQSYMQAYDAAYPEASKQMLMDIDEMDAQLKINGSFILDNIGKLFIDLNHRITFRPSANTLVTPLLYSLPSLPILSVEQAEKEAAMKAALQPSNIISKSTSEQPKSDPKAANRTEEDANGDVVPMPRRWIDIAISAAAAIILFFALSYSSFHQNNTDDTIVVSSASIKAPGQSATKNQHTGTDNHSAANHTADQSSKNQQDTGKPTVTTNRKTFTIVLASGVRQTNAEDYIEYMKRNDFKEARFVNDGKMNRVIYGAYSDTETANEALKSLRTQSSEFKSSWVIELPE